MPTLCKVQAVWSGFLGGPGVSTFYTRNVTTDNEAFHAFFTDIAEALPNDVSIQVDAFGVTVDEATGNLLGGWSLPPVAPVVGTQAGGYSSPTGLAIVWETGQIANSRRIKGRTFMVPLANTNYDTNGQLLDAAKDGFELAAADLIANLTSDLVVWKRPVSGAGGVAHPAIVGLVSKKPAVLRSRRD